MTPYPIPAEALKESVAFLAAHSSPLVVDSRCTVPLSVARRLLERCTMEGECLVWTGHRKPSGYGATQSSGRIVYVHRIAYALLNGPIWAGMEVCHRCDNPPCIHPQHLFLGTHADNVADMRAEVRSRH